MIIILSLLILIMIVLIIPIIFKFIIKEYFNQKRNYQEKLEFRRMKNSLITRMLLNGYRIDIINGCIKNLKMEDDK